jgi:superfamily II DNA or RNA helicase
LEALLRELEAGTPRPLGAVRRAPPPVAARLELRFVLELATPDGRPVLAVLQRRVEADGRSATRWEGAHVTVKGIERYGSMDDRRLLDALLDEQTASRLEDREATDRPSHRFVLARGACAAMYPRLARTGRLWLRLGTGAAAAEAALEWTDAGWRFRLEVALTAVAAPGAAGDERPWEVRGVLERGGVRVLLAEVDAMLEGGFVAVRGELARVDDGGAASWLGMLRTHRTVRITAPRRAAFLEELYAVVSPPVDLPDALALPEVTAPPLPHLFVHAPEGGSPLAALGADLSFVYDGTRVPARRTGRVAFDATRIRLLCRDAAAEAVALSRLCELGAQAGPRAPGSGEAALAIPLAALPALVAALVDEGWSVEAAGRKQRRARAWTMSLSSGVDLLDLRGAVDFDGVVVPLGALLEALRRGDSSVVLDDGSLGVLPARWLARQGAVLRLGVAQADGVRFAASQLPLLDALVAAEPTIEIDASFAAARAKLAAATSLTSLATPGSPAPPVSNEPPPGFRGELRHYQRAGLGWLRAMDRAAIGALLADEMGLGKTVQVLAHLAGRAGSGAPSIVVAPRSLLFNWKREVLRFAPALRLLEHTGPDRRPPGAHFADHDLVLTTYGTLRRDVDALTGLVFDYVILDEAQAIKNDASDTARAARRLRSGRRLALSGTPIENHLGELWSLVEFLNPGMLGRAASWRGAMEASRSPETVALFGRAIRPFMLRRTKTEVAPDLPARLEETILVELDPPARELYEGLRARLRAELLGDARGSSALAQPARVLTALLRLRQAACHPGLLDPTRAEARSAKLEALLPDLVALRQSGQKALVFSQFRALLDLVRPALEAADVGVAQLDGSTRDREAVVERFQTDPAVSVLLVSLKAGGVGLNLTAAEYVFLLDPWWNPAAEAQAIDRAHRIGQTRAVFAYRLIAKDTIEERIAELQERKRMLADSVIRGEGAPLRDLSVEDLDRLLS